MPWKYPLLPTLNELGHCSSSLVIYQQLNCKVVFSLSTHTVFLLHGVTLFDLNNMNYPIGHLVSCHYHYHRDRQIMFNVMAYACDSQGELTKIVTFSGSCSLCCESKVLSKGCRPINIFIFSSFS